MNTDQLKSFIQVAENLNFARAAEILKITQSAVSRQIHSLEDELGTKLLHRTTRTVTLTPAGISFLEDAKNVMGRLKIAEQKLQRHQSTNLQVLTIGCQSEANLDLLFGFQDDIPIKNDTVYKELFWIPLCCIVPAAHPYAARPELAKEELYLENIVVCNSYAIPAKVAEMQNQISQHILPESTYVCENLQVLLTLVRAGYGCSVLPQMNFVNSDICSVPLKNSEPLSYGLFYKKSSQNPLLKKFIAIVTNTPYH